MTHARKSLGQHFLMHPRIANRIALAAGLSSDSIVLEIGPGTGVLTRELLPIAGKVVAVEADQELCEKLQQDFSSEIARGQLELVYGDIRSYSLKNVARENGEYQVVANIPYYLTGELFRIVLSAEHQPSNMTLLVQKEVAERVARSVKESILSLSVKAYGTPRYEFTVKRGAFVPAPKVDSAVLSIRDISRKNFRTKEEEEAFFKLIHAGFAHKRKYVASNIADLVSGEGLRAAEVPDKARAEDIPLSTWLTLARG